MATDRVARLIAYYQQGVFTEFEACLEVLMAAGEGDAGEWFGRLPKDLRDFVAGRVAGVNPAEVRIIESYCGTASPEAYAADLRHREQVMRRGIVALQRITSADSSTGG